MVCDARQRKIKIIIIFFTTKFFQKQHHLQLHLLLIPNLYLLDFFIDCLLKFSVTINWLLKDWLTWPLFDNIGQLLSLLLELINRLLNKSFFIQTRHPATGTIFYGPAKFDLSWYIGPKADTGEYEICLSLSNRTIIIKCLPSMPVHNWNLDSRV